MDMSAEGRIKMSLLYRAMQVHHQLAYDAARPVLPSMVMIAESLIIGCAFTLIKAEPTENPVITWGALCVGVIATSVLTLALRLAVKATEVSGKYVEVKNHLELDPNKILSKYDRKLFNSYYSLKWKIGYSGIGFIITRETIPTVFQDIIIANVINLILVG
jgi:hypothetical protein